MERPSGGSGDRGTRDGSEGQVEHPDEGECDTQESDDHDGSLVFFPASRSWMDDLEDQGSCLVTCNQIVESKRCS